MSKKQTLKAIHNGAKGDKKGWIGLIEDEATYQKFKNNEIEWPEHIEKNMTHVRIPLSLFLRLGALDIYLDELNEAEEQAALDALNLGESNEISDEDGETDS